MSTDILTLMMGVGVAFRRQTSVWEQALLFTGYVTLGDLLNPYMLQYYLFKKCYYLYLLHRVFVKIK